METDQGFDYNPSDYTSMPLLLSRRPDDDKGIEYQRKLMNEKQATLKQRSYEVLRQLWLGMQDAPWKMWPSIYVMKAYIEGQFTPSRNRSQDMPRSMWIDGKSGCDAESITVALQFHSKISNHSRLQGSAKRAKD